MITNRKKYVKHYNDLGKKMFTHCTIPTVGDFANAYGKKNKSAIAKIEEITNYTGNKKDIDASVNRRNDNYSDAESIKFIKSVIAANVTDITASGHFYKKLISSCDDMYIDIDDCKSKGEVFECPVDEAVFNYKIKNHWVTELKGYAEDYSKLPKKGKIHVRSFLTCARGTRCFCKKCAGLFRRSYQTSFMPNNIGAYATLMITEHATQAALDSMNKGDSKNINVLLEQKISDKIKTDEEAKEKIREIIDQIGDVGVESRFYELALLSRWRDGKFQSLANSFLYQEDALGAFIYAPKNKKVFNNLLGAGTFNADSMKTKIAFDDY